MTLMRPKRPLAMVNGRGRDGVPVGVYLMIGLLGWHGAAYLLAS